MRRMLLCAAAMALAASAAGTAAQFKPYRLDTAEWQQLPAGMTWGGAAGSAGGMEFDAQGHLWVSHRSGNVAIMEFDPSGKYLRGFGNAADFIMIHALTFDREGSLWVTDAVGPRRTRGRRDQAGTEKLGFQAFKFARDGKLLMTLGTGGVQGAGANTFIAPADVAVAPNGDVFIADGHGAREGMQEGDRVVKYSREGKFLKASGKAGSKPGEFKGPHAIAIDSKGRVFVVERYNNRIQILDQDLNLLDIWRFPRPSDIAIDAHGIVYVAADDGVWIADGNDGTVLSLMSLQSAEVIALDAQRNLYVSGATGISKYVRSW